jgi:hypothetical protein
LERPGQISEGDDQRVVWPNGDGSLALIVWRSILITWQLAIGQARGPWLYYIFCYLLTFLKLKKIFFASSWSLVGWTSYPYPSLHSGRSYMNKSTELQSEVRLQEWFLMHSAVSL